MPAEVRTVRFASGDVYVGTLQQGQPHGHGKYIWKDGSRFEGDWQDGVRHGAGTYEWSSGACYRGEWVDGFMQGVGTYESPDGSSYQGSWQRDQKHGLGRKQYPNGDCYEGLWCFNKPHGPGRYKWADGNEYDGQWSRGAMHGQGTFVFGTGERYEGEWAQGLEEGVGLFTYQDGSSYDGFWCGGRKHGISVLRRPAAPSTAPAAAAAATAAHKDPSQQLPSSAYAGAAAATAAAEAAAAASSHNGVEAAPASGSRLNSFLRRQPSTGEDSQKNLHALWETSVPEDGEGSPGGPAIAARNCFAAAAGCSNQGQGGPAPTNCLGNGPAAGGRGEKQADAAQPPGTAAAAVACGRNCLTAGSDYRKEQQDEFGPGGGAGAAADAPGMMLWRSNSAVPSREGPKEPAGGEAAAAGVAGGRKQDTVIIQEYDQGLLLRQSVLTPADADFISKRLFKWGAQPAPEQQQHGKKRVNQLGQVVFKGHPAFDLMSQLQLGIRWAVEKGEELGAPRLLGFAECKQKSKTWFPRAGSATTPVHFGPDFKWKDYAPQVFRRLRQLAGVGASSYLEQLCQHGALRLLGSPGKSGAMFFLSADEKFLVKTIHRDEFKLLAQLLPKYYEHLVTYPNSLLVRFFGMHRISMPQLGNRKVRFVVMGNIFRSELHLHQRYDLKGSTLGRTAGPYADQDDPDVIFKDLDMSVAFKLEEGWHQVLMRQLESDTQLLASCGVLDYSLLLGVHYRDRGPRDAAAAAEADPGGLNSFAEHTGELEMASMLEELTRLMAQRQLDPQAAADLLALARLHLLGAARQQRSAKLMRSPTTVLATRPQRSATFRPLASVAGGNEDLASALGMGRVQLGVSMAATAMPLLQQRPSAALCQDVVLYFGIIDFLTPWSMRKGLEAAGKALLHGREAPSAVHPTHYAQRFVRFMRKVFF